MYKMTQNTSQSSLKDQGDYEENNSARVTNKDGDGSTHGDFEENNSARITTKDSDESTLGGLSSPEEYLYDSLEERQKTRLSNRIIESEAPAEQHPTIYRIPAKRLRPIAWTISLDDPAQQGDNKDTLGETVPPKENTQTSSEDEDDARQSKIDAIEPETDKLETDRAASEIVDELLRKISETQIPEVQDKGDNFHYQPPSPREIIYHSFEEKFDTGLETSERDDGATSRIPDELLLRSISKMLKDAAILDMDDCSLDTSTLRSESEAETNVPLPSLNPVSQRPTEPPAAAAWTIPFDVKTRVKDKPIVKDKLGNKFTVQDSLCSGISSEHPDDNLIQGSKLLLKKKENTSKIPMRLKHGIPEAHAPKLTKRTPRKPTSEPCQKTVLAPYPLLSCKKGKGSSIPTRKQKSARARYPRLSYRKRRGSKIPYLRDPRQARKYVPSSRSDSRFNRRRKGSRIPIRVSRSTAKAALANQDGIVQDSQKFKRFKSTIKSKIDCGRHAKCPKQQPTPRMQIEPKKLIKPQDDKKEISEKGSDTSMKNIETIDDTVSVEKNHSFEDDGKQTHQNDKKEVQQEDQNKSGIDPDMDKAMAVVPRECVGEEVYTHNRESVQANGSFYNINIQVPIVPIASLPSVLKTHTAPGEGKLSPNTVSLTLLHGMKSIAKEVEEIKNKMETSDKKATVERAEERVEESVLKEVEEIKSKIEALDKTKIAERVEEIHQKLTKSKHLVINKTTSAPVAQNVENRGKDEPSESPKTVKKTTDAKETNSHDNTEKKSTTKPQQNSGQDDKKQTKTKAVIKKEHKSRMKSNEPSNREPKNVPSKVNESESGENFWERLAKKPARNTAKKNEKSDAAKRKPETNVITKKTAKSETKTVRCKQNTSENAMLANATNVFASGLRFHKCEKKEDKGNRNKSKFDQAKEKYLKLLEEYNKNEDIIENNFEKIEQQERKLDDLYEDVRADRVAFAGYYGEVVDNRKIHCNFKEEAERLRVKHKTNLLAADIYEADTIILQGQIAELQQEIKEARAINRLEPDELKEKIRDIRRYRDDQVETNKQLEEQIKHVKDKLNRIKIGEELSDEEVDNTADKATETETETEAFERIYVKDEENMDGTMVNTHTETTIGLGLSKSADIVSENKAKPPRETKSDQDQSPRYEESAPVHQRALLHRRKSSAERLRSLMKSTDQVETPPGDSDQISPKYLQPILLPSKQPPNEAMPTHLPRHSTWPRTSYTNEEIPGCHIPLPPLHPHIDEGFPESTPLPPSRVFPRAPDSHVPTPAFKTPLPPISGRDVLTPAIGKTPLPPICSGQSDGENTVTEYSPHPPLTPRLPHANRGKSGRRRVFLLSSCLDPLNRDSSIQNFNNYTSMVNKNPEPMTEAVSDCSVSSDYSQLSSPQSCYQPDSVSSSATPDDRKTLLPIGTPRKRATSQSMPSSRRHRNGDNDIENTADTTSSRKERVSLKFL